MILSVKQLTHLSRFAPLKGRSGTRTGTGTRVLEAMRGTDVTETNYACICLRDGIDHPNGHDVDGGCAERINSSDLPPPTFAFVLRAPTCASMCSYSVCWVWCSQPRPYW